MEDILREAFSHPAVEGIIIFGGPEVSGFDPMTLADSEFATTPTGEVVDKLIKELKSGTRQLRTDSEGWSEQVSLFHGDYEAKIYHPAAVSNSSSTVIFKVTKGTKPFTVFLQIDA